MPVVILSVDPFARLVLASVAGTLARLTFAEAAAHSAVFSALSPINRRVILTQPPTT